MRVFWGHTLRPCLDLPALERERKVELWNRSDISGEKCANSFSFPLPFTINTIFLHPQDHLQTSSSLVGTFEACLTDIPRMAGWHYLWFPWSWHGTALEGCQFCKGSIIHCSPCSAPECSFAGEDERLDALPSLCCPLPIPAESHIPGSTARRVPASRQARKKRWRSMKMGH